MDPCDSAFRLSDELVVECNLDTPHKGRPHEAVWADGTMTLHWETVEGELA